MSATRMHAREPEPALARLPFGRFWTWVGAWLVCAWACVMAVDWSFAPGIPFFVGPLLALAWAVLGVNVIVQAVRHGRGAPLGRKILVGAAFPVALLFQPLVMASSIGPPTEICLMTEFSQHRADFDRLAVALDRLAAPRPVEADLTRSADASLDPLLRRLELGFLRRGQPCGFEFVRWSGSFGGRYFEEGFVYSHTPPEDFRYSPDAVGPFRTHRPLGAHWFIFRAAW